MTDTGDVRYVIAEIIIDLLIIANLTFAMVVMIRYYRTWKDLGRKGQPLPLHVWLVSASYYLLLVSLATRTLDWRALIYVPALVAGVASSVVLLRVRPTFVEPSVKPRDPVDD